MPKRKPESKQLDLLFDHAMKAAAPSPPATAPIKTTDSPAPTPSSPKLTVDFGRERYDEVASVELNIERTTDPQGWRARGTITSVHGLKMENLLDNWRRRLSQAIDNGYRFLVDALGESKAFKVKVDLTIDGSKIRAPRNYNEVQHLRNALERAYNPPRKFKPKDWVKVMKGARTGSQTWYFVSLGAYPRNVTTKALHKEAAEQLADETREDLERSVEELSESSARRMLSTFEDYVEKEDRGRVEAIILTARQGRAPHQDYDPLSVERL